MTSILKVDTIQDADGNNIINESGNTITIGASGDTVTIPSGATLDGSNATLSGFATTNGITEADQWRLTANLTGDAEPITSNWERADSDGYGKIGTGMSESSGVFTFPSTGIWKIEFFCSIEHNSAGASQYNTLVIQTTTDDTNFGSASESYTNIPASNFYNGSGSISFIFDCTNTSTHKVRFNVAAENNSTVTQGDTNNNRTSVTFIRLGDT
jgi:hypothetical protein